MSFLFCTSVCRRPNTQWWFVVQHLKHTFFVCLIRHLCALFRLSSTKQRRPTVKSAALSLFSQALLRPIRPDSRHLPIRMTRNSNPLRISKSVSLNAVRPLLFVSTSALARIVPSIFQPLSHHVDPIRFFPFCPLCVYHSPALSSFGHFSQLI